MRYSKHHKTAEIAKLPRAMIAGGVAALVLVAAFLTLTAPKPSTRKVLPEFSLALPMQAVKAPAMTDTKPLRLVYRNSVVPGGVHSAAELAAVMRRDPIAAAHYANFNVAAAHLVQVEKSRMVHVSYRIGNQIYWTKNKVRLALGEALLSDGEHLIRARCGNRIADTVEGPVLLNEPAPEVLETAFVSAEDLIDQTVSMAALGGLPVQPGSFASPASSAADPAPARNFSFDRYGMPSLSSIGTLPGVTVLNPRGAPAQLVDGVVNTTPLPPADPVAPITPVTPVTPTTPVTPADPAAPTTPGTSAPAPQADPGTQPAPLDPVAPLFPVLDNLPGSTPASPEKPFIDPPVFTPAPVITTPAAADGAASVAEPGAAALAVLALAMLMTVRRRRR